jgi:hypothetical protein
VPGLRLVEGFIDEEEERALLEHFDKEELWVETGGEGAGSAIHRRVQHYGAAIDFRARALDDRAHAAAIPALCETLLDRALEQRLVAQRPDQMTVNEVSKVSW